jgi:uncharacterized protein
MLHRLLDILGRSMIAGFIGLLAGWLWIAPAWATGVYQMPATLESDTWVLDQANQIARLTEANLSQDLQALAERTGNQVRFVTIHRLDYGETPQSFADELFEQWFPTPEAQHNQTLIVLDDVTNDIGIRVGEGSAEQLTPAIAESVTQETMKVPLRQNNQYNKAFVEASSRLVAVLSGEADPGPPEIATDIQVEGTFATAEETEANRSNATAWVIVLLVLATVIPMATYYWYQSMGG